MHIQIRIQRKGISDEEACYCGGCSDNLCYNSNGGLYKCGYDGRWRVRKR